MAAHVLALSGDLDIAHADAFEARILQLCADGVPRIVIDLHELRFMDAAGLRAILSAREACTRDGCDLTLTSPSRQVARLFEIVGVDDLVRPHVPHLRRAHA